MAPHEDDNDAGVTEIFRKSIRIIWWSGIYFLSLINIKIILYENTRNWYWVNGYSIFVICLCIRGDKSYVMACWGKVFPCGLIDFFNCGL